MNHIQNTLEISALEQYKDYAPQHVLSAIQTASNSSGVDFSYLLHQANAESSFNASAKASSSSATGLYQFIDSTWLSMMDRYSEDYGIDTTGMSKSEILNLRNDAQTSSFMAAAFASENEQTLERNWGGDIGATELYFAHFMGAYGATSFLKARDENPIRPAADLFPRAANANRNVFYDSKTGEARTLEQVYQFFDKKFETQRPAEEFKVAEQTPEQDQNAMLAFAYSPGSLYMANMDHPVMQRAQEMRDAAATTQSYNSLAQTYLLNSISEFQDQQSLFTDLLMSNASLYHETQRVTNSSIFVKEDA